MRVPFDYEEDIVIEAFGLRCFPPTKNDFLKPFLVGGKQRNIQTDELRLDLFTFRAPFGLLGRLVEVLVLTRYMKNLLLTSNQYLEPVQKGVNQGRARANLVAISLLIAR